MHIIAGFFVPSSIRAYSRYTARYFVSFCRLTFLFFSHGSPRYHFCTIYLCSALLYRDSSQWLNSFPVWMLSVLPYFVVRILYDILQRLLCGPFSPAFYFPCVPHNSHAYYCVFVLDNCVYFYLVSRTRLSLTGIAR